MIGWMRAEDVIAKLRSNGRGVAWTESVHAPYPGHMFHYETQIVTLEEVADYFERKLSEKGAGK